MAAAIAQPWRMLPGQLRQRWQGAEQPIAGMLLSTILQAEPDDVVTTALAHR